MSPVNNRNYKPSPPRLASVSAVGSALEDRCNTCYLRTLCRGKPLGNDSIAKLNSIIKHPKPLSKGKHFYRQSDDFLSVYLVRSGAVKTCCVDKTGREYIIGFYMPGEFFGMDGLINGRHIHSATALNTTAVCEVPFQQLEQSFYSHPDLHRYFLQSLCREIQERQQPLLLLHHKPADERLATFLMDLATRFSERGYSATEFNLPMARRDIADYLGMAAETMSRLFSRFQKDRLIAVHGQTITIIDISRLKSMSISLD